MHGWPCPSLVGRAWGAFCLASSMPYPYYVCVTCCCAGHAQLQLPLAALHAKGLQALSAAQAVDLLESLAALGAQPATCSQLQQGFAQQLPGARLRELPPELLLRLPHPCIKLQLPMAEGWWRQLFAALEPHAEGPCHSALQLHSSAVVGRCSVATACSHAHTQVWNSRAPTALHSFCGQ
jgi:hypothetical protein